MHNSASIREYENWPKLDSSMFYSFWELCSLQYWSGLVKVPLGLIVAVERWEFSLVLFMLTIVEFLSYKNIIFFYKFDKAT